MLQVNQTSDSTLLVFEFSNGLTMFVTLRLHDDKRQSYRCEILNEKEELILSQNGNHATTELMETVLEWAAQAMYYGTEKFTGW